MSRDVFAANSQKILTELALIQDASKYFIGLAIFVEALVEKHVSAYHCGSLTRCALH
jgi:hypothetical protein